MNRAVLRDDYCPNSPHPSPESGPIGGIYLTQGIERVEAFRDTTDVGYKPD